MMRTNNQKTIKLAQFLKLVRAVSTGGEAKVVIQEGFVQVNGATETRRARKLVEGDSVMMQGKSYRVELD